MKKFLFAIVCLFGLAMSAEATGRQAVIVQPVRQAVFIRQPQRVFIRQPQAVIIRNGLFGLRQTVIVR